MPPAISKPNNPQSHPNLRKPSSPSPNSLCQTHHHNSPTLSSTVDLLFLLLVLSSLTFLLSSYFSHLFTSLSLLLSSHPLPSFSPPISLLTLTLTLLSLSSLFIFLFLSPSRRRHKCSLPTCQSLKNPLEFDLQLHSEVSLKSPNSNLINLNNNNKNNNSNNNVVVDIDLLPWKGGTENNPDYECLLAELRKMAPPNGRAVLLFRAKCGCPVAKLIGWGPKKGRKHKKALSNV